MVYKLEKTMHINNFPEKVLLTIFQWMYPEEQYNNRFVSCDVELTNKLALLSVCKKWRRLAMPIVHRCFFVVCSTKEVDKSVEKNSKHLRSLKDKAKNGLTVAQNALLVSCIANTKPPEEHSTTESSNTALHGIPNTETRLFTKSNLDIIPNNADSYRPVRLYIRLEYIENVIGHIYCLIDKLRCNAWILDGVTHLEISVERKQKTPPNHCVELNMDISKAKLMGEMFVQLLPMVDFFEWAVPIVDDVLLEFIRTAYKLYAPQLSRIRCDPVALSEITCFTPNLEYLTMYFFVGGPKSIPAVRAKHLKGLFLSGMDQYYDWCPFRNNLSANIIDFACLESMHMGITYIDSQEGAQNEPQSIFAPTRPFTYNIVAPKLAYLSTYLCPHALSFISAIQGVEILYTVEIFTTQRVHFRFDNLNLDCRAKGMLAKYARESAERMETVDWFKYANDLFSIPGLAEQSKLIVSNSDQPLDIDKINWTELTELEIVSSSLDICNVIKLIARLPNLVSLRLAGIKAETLSNGTLVAFGYLANPFPTDKPISTRLREIALTLDNEKYTESTKSQIAECFYSRIPTLEVFKISNFA